MKITLPIGPYSNKIKQDKQKINRYIDVLQTQFDASKSRYGHWSTTSKYKVVINFGFKENGTDKVLYEFLPMIMDCMVPILMEELSQIHEIEVTKERNNIDIMTIIIQCI